MFELADGIFGTFVTEEWLANEFALCHGIRITRLKFERIGKNEGSFSRVGIMECDSGGRIPSKLIVKIPTCLTYIENRRRRGWTSGDYLYVKDLLFTYHNTETMFYEHARDIPGVPRTFLTRTIDDDRGIICMEYLENAHTRPVYDIISVDEMKSILELYANIQRDCAEIPDDVQERLNRNVFELLSKSTLSLETLTQRFNRMTQWAPGMASVLSELIQLLPNIVNHSLISRVHSECPFRRLLVHGDLYSSNILWQYGEVKSIIDYQMAHYGNPVEDLLRLFTTGLAPVDRIAYTAVLIEHYCKLITSRLPDLKDVLTTDLLLSCYKEIFPMAGVWTIVSLHASFESSTSQEPQDNSKLKAVVEKIYGVAVEILELSSLLMINR